MFAKRLAAGLAAMATLAAGLAVPSAYAAGASFRDVTSSTPHAEDIRWAASAGITTGWRESDGSYTFRGMDTVKRQDMAAFLRREAVRMGVEDAGSWSPSISDWTKFRDVSESTPHADDVLWLAHAGITTGWRESDGTSTFRGMDSVKRQDMAAFMHRLARLAARGSDASPKSFRDVTSYTPHADDIRWLGGSGVSTGYPDGTYRGMVSVYRQDMAAFLHRLDQLKPDKSASPVRQVVVASSVSYNASTFVVREDGSLWAWGRNSDGQLGVGDTDDRQTPVRVMDNVSTVHATPSSYGDYSTFAVKRDGSLWAWGGNFEGQLGVGGTSNRLAPVRVMNDVSTVTSDPAGGSFFAVKRDGSLWAWGRNDSGQLGVGDTNKRRTPVKVTDGVSAVVSDNYSSFAVKKDGSLWAWGDNDRGQLGVGDTDGRLSPVKVTDNVATVTTHQASVFAVRKDGTLWAWGDNRFGQLGVGSTEFHHSTPVKVTDNVATVTTDDDSNGVSFLAVKRDGTLWAWGWNSDGQLGIGGTNARDTPVKVTDNVATVAADGGSVFAVKRDGSLWAWGENRSGQLGVGDTDDRDMPEHVTDNVSTVVTDGSSAFAVRKDGSLWAWGFNECGQLGVGDTDRRLSPARVM